MYIYIYIYINRCYHMVHQIQLQSNKVYLNNLKTLKKKYMKMKSKKKLKDFPLY